MTMHARPKTEIRGKVSNRHGAPQNNGEMKVGPQDSTTNLAGKKKKKSAAATLYPDHASKE